jgi:hypothetical protein
VLFRPKDPPQRRSSQPEQDRTDVGDVLSDAVAEVRLRRRLLQGNALDSGWDDGRAETDVQGRLLPSATEEVRSKHCSVTLKIDSTLHVSFTIDEYKGGRDYPYCPLVF